jgi:hypothetical protein
MICWICILIEPTLLRQPLQKRKCEEFLISTQFTIVLKERGNPTSELTGRGDYIQPSIQSTCETRSPRSGSTIY